jgi:hypothetical protein
MEMRLEGALKNFSIDSADSGGRDELMISCVSEIKARGAPREANKVHY